MPENSSLLPKTTSLEQLRDCYLCAMKRGPHYLTVWGQICYICIDKVQEFLGNPNTVSTNPTEQYGHPMFYELIKKDAQLHSDKNYSYAFGGNPIGNFKRVATIMALYPKMNWATPEMVAEIYALKQMDAYLWLKSNGHADKLEGVNGRLQDRTIYSLIQRCIESEYDG